MGRFWQPSRRPICGALTWLLAASQACCGRPWSRPDATAEPSAHHHARNLQATDNLSTLVARVGATRGRQRAEERSAPSSVLY